MPSSSSRGGSSDVHDARIGRPRHWELTHELPFTESVVEDAALAWLEGLGYAVLHGPEIAAGEPAPSAATRTTATSCWKAACGRRSSA